MSRYTALSTELHFQAVRDVGWSVVLDVGCGDGTNTVAYLEPHSVIGIDGYGPACETARAAGLSVMQGDLEQPWPIDDESVDVVSANQVIEHLADTDRFARECHRVLRPGGTAVISTENLAAWPNIAALLLGQEPFSNSYSKRVWAVGNRLSRRSGPLPEEVAAYPHRSVGSHQAVADLFVQYGFQHARSLGVHTLPTKSTVLRWLRRIDVRHSMYITLIFRKTS
ncbi:MAG: methyltransferase domain-containing protein [Dehalococcoidia bacterium]